MLRRPPGVRYRLSGGARLLAAIVAATAALAVAAQVLPSSRAAEQESRPADPLTTAQQGAAPPALSAPAGAAPQALSAPARNGFTLPAGCTIGFGSLGPASPEQIARAGFPPRAAASPDGGSRPEAGDASPSDSEVGEAQPSDSETGAAASGGVAPVALSDYVDIHCDAFRIQADTVVYDPSSRKGSAEGSVVMEWTGNRLTGARLDFDLGARTGVMDDAIGWIEPEVIVEAKRITKLDEEHVLLESGRFTSCTQPIPYWSFRIGKGLFHLKHYAHIQNVRLNVGRVPVFYVPYALWPIKGDRAAGFLFPEWGNSRKYGWFAGVPFFWPFRENADVTVHGYWFGNAGPAGGLEANWLPTERGSVRLTGFYLDDTDRDQHRWMGRLQFRQPMHGGWRLSGDVNEVSDFLYYQDFERSLADASSTVVRSRVDLIRNGEATSFNIELSRNRQFFPAFTSSPVTNVNGSPEPVLRSELIQESLPSLELRGRSRSIGGAPVYFSFESAADWFRCNQNVEIAGIPPLCTGASWGRLDFEPTISAPLQPLPWLSFEARATARETYYSASRDLETGELAPGDRFDRNYFVLEAETIGPRFYRVFASKSAFSPSYKHVIEPRLVYSYIPTIHDQALVPVIDERDPAAGDVNQIAFSIVNRIFAKRPPKREIVPTTKGPGATETGGTLPWSSFPTPVVTPPPPPPFPLSPESPSGDAGGAGQAGQAGNGPVSTEGNAGPVSTDATGPAPPQALSPALPQANVTAQEPVAAAPAGGTTQETETGTSPVAAGAPVASGPAAAAVNPVEILDVEIAQAYSFGRPLTTVFDSVRLCRDGTPAPCSDGSAPIPLTRPSGERGYGPLSFVLHFNPVVMVSFDLRTDYDLANSAFTANALSGWYRWRAGYMNATWSWTNAPGFPEAGSSQIRAGAGGFLFNRKLTLDADLGYDLARSTSLDRRARVGYYTQCCGFIAEYLERNFELNPRKEIRFVIDLKGIGRFLDPNLSL